MQKLKRPRLSNRVAAWGGNVKLSLANFRIRPVWFPIQTLLVSEYFSFPNRALVVSESDFLFSESDRFSSQFSSVLVSEDLLDTFRIKPFARQR